MVEGLHNTVEQKERKKNITKKSNPNVKFNRTSEIQRRLEIERIRRRQEEDLKKLRKTNRNRLYEDHLRFIKHKINASRQQERNHPVRPANRNQAFHEVRQRMQEAASREAASREASRPSDKVHAPQSWRNYLKQKIGW